MELGFKYQSINGLYLHIKRSFDFLLALICLIPAGVVVFIASIFIKIFSPGPIIFSQKRVGRNGKEFTIYKLRTMYHDRSDELVYTTENDSRIYPLGKLLRKTKIDELPQLYNVLIGDMSIVGPRPERVEYVEDLAKNYPSYNARHLIRPGITGLAQIHHPTATPDDTGLKLEYDLEYVENASFFLDLLIIFKTFRVVFRGISL